MNYFATYAGFVFIITWVYQFLKFEVVRDALGVTDVENIPINGNFWGFIVLSEEQLLFRVIALSALLVLSVIGNRTVNAKDKAELDEQLLTDDDAKNLDDDELYYKVLKQRENILWTQMSVIWPVIDFCATFFHIPLTLWIVYESLFWRLSWTMIIYLFFSIGPWYNINLDFIGTRNLGKEKPLNFYANAAVREQRLKRWKTLMFVTIIAWIVIFPSQRLLNILNISVQSRLIFYGVWAGVLYPNTSSDVTFWNHVSGYLWILLFLVIEKKCLEWLVTEETRISLKAYEATEGGKNDRKNYETLTKEVERRQEIENRRFGKSKGNKKIGFAGLDDEGKLDPKEQIKQTIDDLQSRLSKKSSKKDDSGLLSNKKEESKAHGVGFLKSAMKKPKTTEPIKEEANESSKQLEVIVKSQEDLVNGNDTEEDFNNLFARSDDPKQKETRDLLLFQYKIKFMRGAKTFVEELMTFTLLL